MYGIFHINTVDGKFYGAYDFDVKHYKNFNPRVIENGVRIQTMVRIPNHICVWKTDVAKRVPFHDKSLGEDHDWAYMQQTAGYKFLKLETDLPLYHYRFSKLGTQTRLR
jgi:hypothetical protein